MTFLQRILRQSETTAVRRVTAPEDLSAFLEPDCPAALWDRDMPKGIARWLADLDRDQLPSGRVVLPRGSVAQTVGHLCDMAELPAGPERDWLETDIVAMAELFADLMRARYLRLRLDVVETNACRRFHVDAIMARLVCTYRGTGTQFGQSRDGADPERIETVKTGAPILLRGTLWPETPASDLLHRSPPIEGTGESRLVLVLDPVLDPDDEV